MDPLSVTSGVVGIVAFAFQLAKTASKVKRAMEEVRSAPKEARELIERLAMLETTCELIGFHLERRDTLPNPASPTLDILSKALGQFLAKAQELEQILLDLSACNELNQTPWPKFGTVSRVRLVLRKDKIIFLVQEIDRVISLLQFVIQVDIWTSTTIPAQPSSLISIGAELVDRSPNPERGSSTSLQISEPSQYAVARKVWRAQNQRCRTIRYLGYITWTITDGWIGDGDDDDANYMAYRKRRITFRLPYTSMQCSLHYYGGMGTPSYALNVTHIIDHNSELGQRLFYLMRPDGALEELREMVSSRELSIYSVYQNVGEECNLYFMAVAMRWAEGCRYLLQHDFRHKFEDDETPTYMFSLVSKFPNKVCEVTETFLSVRPHDMRERDLRYLLNTGCQPEYFGRYLTLFLKSPAIDHSRFLSWAWRNFMFSVFGKVYTSSSWVPALHTFIEHGVNLHRLSDSHGVSPYIMILSMQVHPFEADHTAYSWLEMLRTCGVDISSYLETENTLVDKYGFGQGPTEAKEMKKITLDIEGLPMPSWRWKLPTESSIIELLQEFRILGRNNMEWSRGCRHDPEGPNDFNFWKARHFYGDSHFPFLLCPLDHIKMGDYRMNRPWGRETFNRAVEIRDKRIARRQAKKWKKAHPGEKPLSDKMPGTWVE